MKGHGLLPVDIELASSRLKHRPSWKKLGASLQIADGASSCGGGVDQTRTGTGTGTGLSLLW